MQQNVKIDINTLGAFPSPGGWEEELALLRSAQRVPDSG